MECRIDLSRKRKGLSQEQLESLGVARQTIANGKRGFT